MHSRPENNQHDIFEIIREFDGELSPEAQFISSLVTAVAFGSFDPTTFDGTALFDFLNQPTLRIPNHWTPFMSEITQVLLECFQKFPAFDGIDFGHAITRCSR